MQRRYNLAHWILAIVVALGLMPLVVCVDAQAQGRIAFRSNRDGNPEIYVMDADGGNQHNLSNNDSDESGPSWSPDGKRIAFASNRNGNWEIYVMDTDGRNPQRLTESRLDDVNPAWSPDGKRIAFASNRNGNYEIYAMDINGKNQRRLTDNPNHDISPTWLHSPFSVSPAGKKITTWGQLKRVKR